MQSFPHRHRNNRRPSDIGAPLDDSQATSGVPQLVSEENTLARRLQ